MRSSNKPLLALLVGLYVLLGAARAHSQQDLPQRVDAAIHRGRAALLPRLAAQLNAPPKEYPMGNIALSLAALLKSHVPTSNRVIQQAFEQLETMAPTETYSVACYLFALDAFWQATYKESLQEAKRGGKSKSPPVPRVPPDGPVRSKMQSLVSWLTRGAGGSWNYRGRGGGDLSNTQFAVLGLEIGLQNNLEVPGEVFRAVAEQLVSSYHVTGEPISLGIIYLTPAWEGITPGRTRVANAKVAPGGWSYSFDPKADPSSTMTAAGASSLLVARRALNGTTGYDPKLAREVDRQVEGALAWISTHFASYLASGPWLFYGLYGLEKVGDISSAKILGKYDWYLEGARLILRLQLQNGTWGSEVNTSFALLFLTRATRSHVQTFGPPVVITSGDGTRVKDDSSDLVFVSKLGGFVSASTLFGFLAETRDPLIIPLVEEAEKGFPPHRVHQVFSLLLPLWSDENDAVTQHARTTLESIAGIRGGDRRSFETLGRGLGRLRELERAGVATGLEVAELLDSSESPLLARRALDLVDRLGLLEAFPAVISKLTSSDAHVLRRSKEVLARWTGERAPITHADDPAPTVAAAWRAWWAREGNAFVASRRAARLIEDIDRANDGLAQDAAARGLSKLGQDAVPHILHAMEKGEYSIHLVRVLETITGKTAGIRSEDWRKQLAGSAELK